MTTTASSQTVAQTGTQTVTDELRRWIIAQAEAGCRPEDVVAAMVKSGWDEGVALAAMETTLRERLDEVAASREPAPPAVPVPEPKLDGAPPFLTVGGHRIQVLTTMRNPRVVVFGGLLSDDECDGLIELARPRLARSETVDNATGGSEVNAARTSDGMFFERGESPLIAAHRAAHRRRSCTGRWTMAKGCRSCATGRAPSTGRTTTTSTPSIPAPPRCCSAAASASARW